ncbi:prophage LambdaCh01 nuclease domain-containing protein [Carboxydothermus islandicus]|uniref:Prophage LambdaCh01 nuclease domain-containing protein n=1 Tax=Carboxydothermus islandicus TaxID=661089 RepID=A0A1L8D0Q4_9THEO|nr:thermonuclease family protein [Carboxydothermus islandicus]GAV24765.1 prophage LambdaCh01 nuclease domain-containing protein [Carboxydothermus islandicus]
MNLPEKFPWFRKIPGFRSGKPLNMIIASIFYFTYLVMAISIIRESSNNFWETVAIFSLFFLLPISVIASIFLAFKRDPLWKKWLAGAGIAFLVFFVSVINSPTSQAPNNNTSKPTSKQEVVATSQQNQSTTDSLSSEKTPTIASQSQNSQTNENTQQSSQDQQAPIPLIAAKVTKVVDGDTIYVRLPNGSEEKVRFIGVDTPESTIQNEPYGNEASNYTKSKLAGKTVYLEKDVSERDKYGRLLRYIWLAKPKEISESEIRSKMFNAILLLGGYAQVATYPPDVKYVDFFTKFQQEAREAEKGLWGISPTQEEDISLAIQYVGNKNSRKFHYEDCRWAKKIAPSNRVYFKSREAAINAGYVPCKVCNP